MRVLVLLRGEQDGHVDDRDHGIARVEHRDRPGEVGHDRTTVLLGVDAHVARQRAGAHGWAHVDRRRPREYIGGVRIKAAGVATTHTGAGVTGEQDKLRGMWTGIESPSGVAAYSKYSMRELARSLTAILPLRGSKVQPWLVLNLPC